MARDKRRKLAYALWKELMASVITAILFVSALASTALAVTKVSFPFTPISAASLPWWIAKESRYYEKYGLDVDMIYVGASPVIIQAMLGGQAGVGAGGGPPLVSNVLQGGDVVQVATTVPYAIQSLIVKPEIRTPADLVGKRIGISRLGAIPHFTLQAIVKLHNVQGINIVQTGTTTVSPNEGRLSRAREPEGLQKSRHRIFNSRPGRAQILRRQESRSRHRYDQGDDGRNQTDLCQRETRESGPGEIHAPNRPRNTGSNPEIRHRYLRQRSHGDAELYSTHSAAIGAI